MSSLPGRESRNTRVVSIKACQLFHPEQSSGGSLEALKALSLQCCSSWVQTYVLRWLMLFTYNPEQDVGKKLWREKEKCSWEEFYHSLWYMACHWLSELFSCTQSLCSDFFPFKTSQNYQPGTQHSVPIQRNYPNSEGPEINHLTSD